MIRCHETAKKIADKSNFKLVQTKTLDDLNYGICDGMTLNEINEKYPRVNEVMNCNNNYIRKDLKINWISGILVESPIVS